MNYEVKVSYYRFDFAIAENAMTFAKLAAEHFVPDKYERNCNPTITITKDEENEKDGAKE